MAVTIYRSDRYPVGTSVGAYPRPNRVREAHPSGTAAETNVVAADGSLGPYTTLTKDRPYVLYAEVEGAHRYVEIEDSSFTPPAPGLIERITARREALGIR